MQRTKSTTWRVGDGERDIQEAVLTVCHPRGLFSKRYVHHVLYFTRVSKRNQDMLLRTKGTLQWS